MMCGGYFMSKNPEEAIDFLSYMAKVSRGWNEPNAREVGRMKSQPNASNVKAGMYTLSEDTDVKAKFVAMARRLEELEVKKIREVQAILEVPMQAMSCSICQSLSTWWRSVIRCQLNHPNFSWKPREPQYTQPGQAPPQASNLEQAIVNLSKVMGDFIGDQKSINAQLSQRIDNLDKKMDGRQNDLSQKIDNLQYSISRLTNLNTVQEKCKSIVKYKDPGCPTILVMIGETCVENALLDLGASVNLLPYSVYKQLGLGELNPTSITLSLVDRSMKIQREGLEEVCMIGNLVEEHCDQKMLEDLNESFGDLDQGLPKPLDLLATLPLLKLREEILPLFNKEET
ncbi:hypothetical protein CK203_108797 [Vitis vinifera]|uniref:Uncharacterized protein n=1 Tax=Vitis vinifera TaxID=29760 RepID=A0A438BP78_VITVI|nr:hypothetical protein CK203_108797 [Vitis vinifera]